tara:strand:- start:847 stop:987 length:141 start_codon:yes stop_codon:yes gene_type:complete
MPFQILKELISASYPNSPYSRDIRPALYEQINNPDKNQKYSHQQGL